MREISMVHRSRILQATGYKIDQKEYRKEATRCVDAYVRSINGKIDNYWL